MPLPFAPRPRPAAGRNARVVTATTGWLALGLTLDAGAGAAGQLAIGGATWVVLLSLLRAEGRAVRAQVAVAVAVATAMEYALSPAFGFYTYRLHNVPTFVPPGHGLVYLAALAVARSDVVAPYRRVGVGLALSAGGAWALWGATLAGRPDTLGAVLYLVFAGCVLAGRAPLVYAAAFAVTAALELFGTALGIWAWAPHDPSGWLTAGNPPSGIPAAYCVLDAIALAAGPAALRLADGLRAAVSGAPSPPVVAADPGAPGR